MSSYALGAIQMMTPSTFRRRNVSSRTKGSARVQNQNNRLSRKENQTSTSKSKSTVSRSTIQSKTSCPPNTLTFFDHNNNNMNMNNNSGSSGNFGLSQLTMSQLSDSISHHRNESNLNLNRPTNRHSSRPSKVARTATRSRPSTRQSTALSRSSNDIYRSFNNNTRQISNSTPGRASGRLVIGGRARGRPSGALPVKSSKSIRKSGQPKEISQLSQLGGAFHPHHTTHPEEEAYESQSQSQLRSQNLLSLPPPTRTPNSRNQGRRTSSSTNNSCCPAPTRKRSWMEACVEVIKTPYRKGKAISQQVAQKIIKIDIDDDEDEGHDDYHHDANDRDNAIPEETVPQRKVVVKTCEETPYRAKKTIPSTHNSSMNAMEAEPKTASTLDAPSNDTSNVPPSTNSTSSVAPTNPTSTNETSRQIQMLNESKELWKKIELTKKEMEKERKELQDSHVAAVQEIRNERKLLKIEKDTIEEIRKDLQSIRNDCNDKTIKLSLHVKSAEEAYDAKVLEFNQKHANASEQLRTQVTDAMTELKAKNKTVIDSLDSRLASFEKTRCHFLNSIKTEELTFQNTLKEMKSIEEELEPKLMNLLKETLSLIVEDEKRKMVDYVQKEIILKVKEISANISPCFEKTKTKSLFILDNKENQFTGIKTNRSSVNKIDKIISSCQEPTTKVVNPECTSDSSLVTTSSKLRAKQVSPIQSVSSTEKVTSKRVRTVSSGAMGNDNVLLAQMTEYGQRKPNQAIQQKSKPDSHIPKILRKSVGNDINAITTTTTTTTTTCTETKKSVGDDVNIIATCTLAKKALCSGLKYNLRSRGAKSIRGGITDPADIGSKSPLKQTSKDGEKTTNTNRSTTKKKSTKRRVSSSSQRTNDTCIQQQQSSKSTGTSIAKTKQNTTEMTSAHSTTQVLNNIAKKQGCKRRRRMNAFKPSDQRSSSFKTPKNQQEKSEISLERPRRTTCINVPFSRNSFRSPVHIAVSTTSRHNANTRGTSHTMHSPVGVDSIFGPPEIPDLDGTANTLSGFRSRRRAIIQPRTSFLSNFDSDTLSFK